jgi:hypothetical protein
MLPCLSRKLKRDSAAQKNRKYRILEDFFSTFTTLAGISDFRGKPVFETRARSLDLTSRPLCIKFHAFGDGDQMVGATTVQMGLNKGI